MRRYALIDDLSYIYLNPDGRWVNCVERERKSGDKAERNTPYMSPA